MDLLRGPADRQRQARPPPRVGTDLQGPLLPLPHHAGPLRRPSSRLGLPRPAGRGRGREATRHRRQAPDRRRDRHRRVRPPVPRVGRVLRQGVARRHRPDRLLARPRGRLLDPRPELHRVGVVAASPTVRPGPALRGLQGGPVLPPLRHRPVQPRARTARRLPGRGGRVGVRAAPAPRRRPGAGRRRHRPARLDDHAVDPHLQHRGGGAPGPHLRSGRRDADRRGAGRRGHGARCTNHGAGAGARSRRPPVPAPVRSRGGRSRC